MATLCHKCQEPTQAGEKLCPAHLAIDLARVVAALPRRPAAAARPDAPERAGLVEQLRRRGVADNVIRGLEAACDAAGDLAALRAAVADPRVRGAEGTR